MKRVHLYVVLLFFVVISSLFFYKVLLQGKIPIAADAIVGLYHPFRDFYREDYPNGIPFKNFLITDPVRQQYPWRFLAVDAVKDFQLPLWNPYSGTGTPLLANFQTAILYPLNVLFFFLPFTVSWTVIIISQVLLSGIFMYFYLKNLRLSEHACILGAITFSFCGFSISWLTWNTIDHVMLWLPLILLACDKLLLKRTLLWFIILIFAGLSSMLAGHLQTLFYLSIISATYLFMRILQTSLQKNSLKKTISAMGRAYAPFLVVLVIVLSIASIQWLPTLRYLPLTARSVDRADWRIEGWFIPWQNLIQFLVPDFFGNPATLNYWGVWNYGELTGYIGIVPFLMAIFALLFRRDKKTAFFGALFFFSLVFSLPTILAKLPYIFSVPFLSSAQPTRLLSVMDFSLAILSALGLDMFIKRKRGILYPIFLVAFCFVLIWSVGLFFFGIFGMTIDQAVIARNNLKLPTIIFASAFLLLSLGIIFKGKRLHQWIVLILVLVSLLDLLRFGWKFTPFTNSDYLYPQTKALAFLGKDRSVFRIMTTDSRLFPPNFSVMYALQSVDLYDPLYLRRYGEFIAATERGEPNISPPFGFNRIITPHSISSSLLNLLNVKYVLSLSDISSERFKKVYAEGGTMIFENKENLQRAFFARRVIHADNANDAIKVLFQNSQNLGSVAVVEGARFTESLYSTGTVSIISYSAHKVELETKNQGRGFLVLTDAFFPSWKATIITGTQNKQVTIYRTDFNFRGIILPPGEHKVVFTQSLL